MRGRAILFSNEDCRPFFEKRVHSFMFVGRCAQPAEDSGLQGESFVQRQICPLTHRLQAGCDGDWSLRGDLEGQRTTGFKQRGGRHYLVDQADAEGFRCRNDIGGQDQPQGC